jgi:SNF2 family DNA or RNA helicase
VFDEGHNLRNAGSKVHAIALAARHKWALTGTPVVNAAADMWALLQVLGFVPAAGCHVPCAGVMRRILKAAMLRRTASRALGDIMPKIADTLERVAFDSTEEAELYARVEAHCRHRAWKASRTGNDGAVMEALGRCRQMTVHPELVIRAARNSLTNELPSSWPFMSTKLRVVSQLVVEHSASEKVLVFCTFIDEMELICMVLRQQGLQPLMYCGQQTTRERDDVVRRFQSCPEDRVMVVQIQAGGTGLNLHAASRVIISSIPERVPQGSGHALRSQARLSLSWHTYVCMGDLRSTPGSSSASVHFYLSEDCDPVPCCWTWSPLVAYTIQQLDSPHDLCTFIFYLKGLT